MAEIINDLTREEPFDARAWVRFVRSYILLFLGPILLLIPIILRGEVLFWGTPSLQFIPWWQFAVDSLREGVLPYWNPLNGMGAPLIANYQLGFFYPPNWFLLAAGVLAGEEASAAGIAWGFLLLSLLHFTWAGLGMAMFIRRLGLPWLGQIIGGLAYGLSGYIVARLAFYPMVWVAAWLPWVMLFTEQIAGGFSHPENHSSRKILWIQLAACYAMQLLAGHAQLTWYSILLAGLWMLVSGWRSGGWRGAGRGILIMAGALVLAAAVSAVQLVPTFEFLQQSQRSDSISLDVALTYSFWPWRLLTIFAPDFFGNPAHGDFWGYASYWEDHMYMGMLPVLLAFSTLVLLFKEFTRRLRTPRWGLIAFLWTIILITFILAMGRYTPIFPFLYFYIPTFDMFQAPARYLLWAAFALPVLAALAVERWRSPTGKGLYWFRLGAAGTFAVTVGAGLASILLRQVQMTFVRAAALAGLWALGFALLTLVIPWANCTGRMHAWRAVVILWAMTDLLITGWLLNPSAPTNIYLGSVTAPPLQSGERLYLDRQTEYDLKFSRFLRFGSFRPLEDWRGMREAYLPNLNLLERIPSMNNFDPLVPDGYARWMKTLDEASPEARRSWLAWAGVGATENIDLSQPNGVRFDRLEGAARWHFVSCARTAADDDAAWRSMQQEMRSPVRQERMVVLEVADVSSLCAVGSSADIRLISESPDRLVFDIEASDPGWFEVMDVWYPGWTAEIDGEPLEIYRADGLFRALAVQPGRHKIVMRYRPTGFIFALLFSILVLFGTIIWWRFWGRK